MANQESVEDSLGKLYLSQEGDDNSKSTKEDNLESIAQLIKSKECKNIIVMTGAGLSTAAGIPDFRSPDIGLFTKVMQKYQVTSPELVFSIDYFHENPSVFYEMSRGMTETDYKPTIAHYFLKLLADKNLLLRHYTQNVDGLDLAAGLSEDKVVTAHGTMYTAHCTTSECHTKYTLEWLKQQLLKTPDITVPRCDKCQGVIKPDVVLYGEQLPNKFFTMRSADFPNCDLLIIMGTSLKVEPFASLVEHVPEHAPRLLINLEETGQDHGMFSRSPSQIGGMVKHLLGWNSNRKDIFWKGSCDDGCLKLADLLGWKQELLKLKEDQQKKPSQDTLPNVKL
ncbi:uncharacterized protein TRIADDRAFT_26603 [Trichoplax adhaerens]|uniref:NAD-dependent protein deacetylase n=1 Tax=Trichoplax adhaerens TaxID=10228 RepID=B3RZX6_TRIAD|nr:hypothetical protein TRIADDRAFT_26603 [Trichoplax adhaerens]EDV23909.1 hypothetical protein TRIADDRAFT_26603 [Trichoplax adhaerens]|eukprot:XP_002113435.1 hypothetical protein TRIADDRAFT_26603 [Trichoplax adhaerens]